MKNNRSGFPALMVFCLVSLLPATEYRPLPTVIKPDVLAVRGDDVLIAQGAQISIYSLAKKDIVHSFGRRGTGPREFQLLPTGTGLRVDIYEDFIFVGSIGKASWLGRDGHFIREQKISPFGRMTPFQEGFAGVQMTFVPDRRAPNMAFYLYHPQGAPLREIATYPTRILHGPDVTLLDMVTAVIPHYHTSPDRIFIAGKQTFQIDIYDEKGEFLRSITQSIPRRVFTPDEKKAIRNVYRIHPVYKNFWNRIEKSVKIPDHFPEFREFTLSGDRLFVLTFQRREDKSEFLVFDLSGKSLGSAWLPVAFQDIVTPYLYAFSAGNFYQLTESEAEDWQLAVTPVTLDGPVR